MDTAAIESALKEALPGCDLTLAAEGNKLSLKIVSDEFDGLNRVKRQQKIYALLNDRIQSGEIHAVSMVTLTTSEADS